MNPGRQVIKSIRQI